MLFLLTLPSLSRPWQLTGNVSSIIKGFLYFTPITVLRSQNLGILRLEKSWRPIVTLEVDGQHKHEIALGIDGQNPNQREIMHLYVAILSTMARRRLR